jgi:hypothetical protein
MSYNNKIKYTYIHTTYFIPEGLAGTYSCEMPTIYQNYLATRNIADPTGGKSIAVWLQPISGVSAINPLIAFTTSMEERERCYSFILSRIHTRHGIINNWFFFLHILCGHFTLGNLFPNVSSCLLMCDLWERSVPQQWGTLTFWPPPAGYGRHVKVCPTRRCRVSPTIIDACWGTFSLVGYTQPWRSKG